MEKKKNKIHRKFGRSFYKKTLMVSICTIAAVALAITATIYISLNRSVDRTLEQIETTNAQRIAQNFKNTLDLVCSISGYFATLDSIPIDYMDVDAKSWVKTTISSTLNSYLLNHDYITGIRAVLGNTQFSAGKMQESSFTKITEYNGVSVSVCDEDAWPYYLQFESNPSRHSVNKITLQIKAETMAGQVFTVVNSQRDEYIIHPNGTVLLSSGSGFFQPISTLYDLDLQTPGFMSATIDSRHCYITIEPVGNEVPFYYVSIIDAGYYYSFNQNAITQSALIGFVLVTVSVLFVYFIITYTYKPIREISDTFQHYYPDTEINENEIQFINTQIRKTIRDKQNLEEQLPETIKKLNHAQIRALQSQINPHFLFNTLENIKSISVKNYGIDNEIEQSLILLDTILFESINQKNILSTIGEEIHITKCYISLMELRYSQTFTTTWDIQPPEIERASIIRFTLQPIVENSILKGFDPKRSDNQLHICIHSTQADIQIRVIDNGRGMPPERLEALRADLNNLENQPADHIGLKNVNFRIKLLYGINYGITNIESSPEGTCVELKIPRIYEA